MKKFIQENKRVIAILCSVIVIIIIFIVGSLFLNNKNNNGEEASSNTFFGSYKYNQFDLPDLTTLSYENAPIMYDYCCGANGWHSDIVNIITGNDFIFCTKNESSNLYFSYINYNSNGKNIVDYLPTYSYKPYKYNIKSDSERRNIYKSLDEDNQVSKYTEGEYKFYVVSNKYVSTNISSFYGINIAELESKCEYSYMQNQLSNGVGYDTSIIRSKSDLDYINKTFHVNFNDSFWDKQNYNSNIKSMKKNDGYNSNNNEYIILTPITERIISDGDYINTYMINYKSYSINANGINELLQKNGYEDLETAISNKQYADTYEVEENRNITHF